MEEELKPSRTSVPHVRSKDQGTTRRLSSKSCPPYNPELQQLVQGKNTWAEPIDVSARAQGFKGWHQRGYLPHHDIPGLRQFVTFRLCDSLPASRRGEWNALLRIEDNRQRRVKLERYLDLGRGECWLNQPSIAELAEEALRHSNGQHYELLAWVIMPNHIHVLFRVWNLPMSQVIKSWKTHIALEANKVLCRHGPFWERDYWDTYMRDEDQLLTARRYIEQNPVKAKLVLQSSHWPWSGARFRDSYGKLPPNP